MNKFNKMTLTNDCESDSESESSTESSDDDIPFGQNIVIKNHHNQQLSQTQPIIHQPSNNIIIRSIVRLALTNVKTKKEFLQKKQFQYQFIKKQ